MITFYLGVIAIVLHKYCRKVAINLIVKMIKKPQRTSRMITLINNITDAILSTDEHGYQYVQFCGA